jgi:hypothetical protein
MAIYNIFDYYEKETYGNLAAGVKPSIDPGAFSTNHIDENFIQRTATRKDQLFSALAARFFFFLLLIADLLWGVYSIVMFTLKASLHLFTFWRFPFLSRAVGYSWLSIKRSIVCALSLFIAIFTPALGIMFSCMYFLMYDKTGVDEVVPSSLRDQFKELFPSK